jgi:hypothetical protein
VNGWQRFGQVQIHHDLRRLELMLQQRKRIANDLVEVGVAEFRCGGTREVQQPVGDFRGAETLLRDFLEHWAQPDVALHLLREHLRIGRDDGQRRVDFVGHAGREQANGAELVGLGELRFKRHALRDVVYQDDAADGNEIAREQGSDGDVGHALLAGAGDEAEFVEVVHAGLIAEACQRLNELGGEDGAKRPGRELRCG